MVKIRLDRLVTDTSQRLYGLSALIDLIDEAHPKVWEQGKEALSEWAKNEHWDYGDYSVEAQFLEANFTYWLPKEEAYSIIVLLSSIVETQLLAYAGRTAEQKGCAFNRKDFKNKVLNQLAAYIKKVSGSDLTKNERWEVMKDLQRLRNIIVHGAGKPDEVQKHQLKQICKRRPGISLNENPFTMWHDPEISLTVRYCRYFAREVEEFFKGLFKDADFPVESGLWPNIQSGLP
jgi:hypothetical protein